MKLKSLLSAGCVFALTLTPAASAQAKPAPAPAKAVTPYNGPTKIAVIDIQKAIATTAEGKKLNGALQARFAPKRTQLQNEQNEIQKLNGQLSTGGDTMSATAKSQLQQEISTKERSLQQDSDNAQQDYQQQQTALLNTVGNKMMPIVKTYAEQHGYTEVIDVSLGWPQNPVLYYNPGTVITDAIVKLYDQAHPAGGATTKK